MADRTNTINVRSSVSSFPSIQVSMGQSSAFKGIAQVLGKVADAVHDDLDRQTQVEAKRAGAVAGATGTPTLREDETTIAGEAFNQAARQNYTNQLDLRGRVELSKIAARNKADPAAFAKEAQGYINGLMGEAAQVSPDIAALLKGKFDLEIASHTTQINGVKIELVKDQHVAGANILHDQLMKDLKNVAPDLLSGEEGRALQAADRIAAERNRLVLLLGQTGADGLPMFKASDAAKRLTEFDDAVLDMALRGVVDASENKNDILAKLQSGQVQFTVRGPEGTATTVNPLDGMTRDAQESLISYATTQANTESRRLAAAEQTQRRQVKETERQTARDLYRLLGARELTPEWVNENRDNMDPATVRVAEKALRGGGAIEDDKPTVISLMAQMGVPGDDQRAIDAAYMADQLTLETYTSLSGQNASNERRTGPGTVLNRNLEFMRGLIRESKNLEYSDIAGVEGAILDLQNWFDEFPNTATKDGQPIGRPPTAQETRAKVRELLLDHLARGSRLGGGSMSLRSQLAVPINSAFSDLPDGRFVETQDGSPGRVDVEKTKNKINSSFGITSQEAYDKLPDEKKRQYQRQMAKLRRYQKADQEFTSIMEKINALE